MLGYNEVVHSTVQVMEQGFGYSTAGTISIFLSAVTRLITYLQDGVYQRKKKKVKKR
ncbi:hypothetical protein ODV97_18870 [Enterococcus gallinarum]|nr:hypothetical protein [Enterococcus gallinarum]